MADLRMVTKMHNILGWLLTTHISIDVSASDRIKLDDRLRFLSKVFGAEDLFGGSEVGRLLVLGRPEAACSLVAHAFPQVG